MPDECCEPIDVRSVRPRTPHVGPRSPILCYSATRIYRERDDSYHSPSDLPRLAQTEPPSLFIAEAACHLLCRLDEIFRDDPQWQFKVKPIERGRNRNTSDKEGRFSYAGVNVDFFGFKGKPADDGPRGGKLFTPNRYHRVIDPATFCGRMPTIVNEALADTTGDATAVVDALYIWARNVREWTAKQGLKLGSSNGSLGAQLLKDPRFYPEARRKVPSFINEKMREILPGNHYELFAQTYQKSELEYDAFYLDQVSSHHTIAATVALPDANNLFQYGHTHTLIDKPGIPPHVSKRILDWHGALYCKIHVPHLPPNSFPPPYAKKHGRHCVYLFTNELPLLKRLKITVEYVIAAWVSPTIDAGLPRYAEWAKGEVNKCFAMQKEWLKPTLLATYGILAAKPRKFRTGYARCINGTETQYPAGAGWLDVIEKSTERATEPGTTNVLHRCMIEAETRKRSMELAYELNKYHKFKVLALYADSVIVESVDMEGMSHDLPLLPPEWRLQAEMTHLRFHSAVGFTSDQVCKLPGVPRAAPDFPGASDVLARHGRRAEVYAAA
jgi:hypothetical protein